MGALEDPHFLGLPHQPCQLGSAALYLFLRLVKMFHDVVHCFSNPFLDLPCIRPCKTVKGGHSRSQ